MDWWKNKASIIPWYRFVATFKGDVMSIFVSKNVCVSIFHKLINLKPTYYHIIFKPWKLKLNPMQIAH